MKVAIVGYGIEGKVSFDYFSKLGHDVTICDENPNAPIPEKAKTQLGKNWDKNLDQFDIVVRSAGFKPSKILKNNPGIEPKITSAVNEFLAKCPTKNVIGITGTKGKGTTSTLTAKMLEQAGKKVWLAGNIGRSPLEFINQIKPEDYVVLELSSFQLMDLKTSPRIAVCVLVEPEHLDWHADLDEYIGAKQQLFTHQSANDLAVFYNKSELSQKIASASKGKKLSYFDQNLAHVSDDTLMIGDQIVCKTSEIPLPGKHNLQNICAAITAVWGEIKDLQAVKEVVTKTGALPYRIQPIATKNGINYYNDSFSSTPTATIAAIEAINGPQILIIGGKDKNTSVNHLVDHLSEKQDKIRQVILIGELSQKITKRLDEKDFNKYTNLGITNMTAIMNKVSEVAEPGDNVILSPGSSSFDMFKNFQDRGDQFNQAVENL